MKKYDAKLLSVRAGRAYRSELAGPMLNVLFLPTTKSVVALRIRATTMLDIAFFGKRGFMVKTSSLRIWMGQYPFHLASMVSVAQHAHLFLNFL